jgi:bis(5'-nucleosyl)-tetraphosphatase (symmetrical)
VIELGDAVTTVLGNHDLHLLATFAGVRKPAAADTLDDVLDAPDVDDLIDWLRRRPLLHWDRAAARVLVHAGIPPQWDVATAASAAAEIETELRGPDWRDSLRHIYGNAPSAWSADLGKHDRRRYTINALTRMRYCDARGRLELTETGPPGSQPQDLKPWFDAPKRAAAGEHIVFGHWASLGLLERDGVTALDSGCVWGGALTAVPLDPPGAPIGVPCRGHRTRRAR